MPTSLPKETTDQDQRTHRRWAVSVFAAYAIALACLFGFMASHPKAVESVSNAAQEEFTGSIQQPVTPDPVQLAARKATVK